MNIENLQKAIDRINESGQAPSCPHCGGPAKIALKQTPFGLAVSLRCASMDQPASNIDEAMDEIEATFGIAAFTLPMNAIELMLAAMGINPKPVMHDVARLVAEFRQRVERERAAHDGEQLTRSE